MNLTHVNIFPHKAPSIVGMQGGAEFHAVLEDDFEATMDLTSYPVEIGARMADHGIIMPRRYKMTAAISQYPLGTSLTDFIPGALSNLTDNPYVTAAAGLLTGALGGSYDSAPAAALEMLMNAQQQRIVMEIDAVDVYLQNMMIRRIRRVHSPEVETALIVEIEFIQVPLLSTVLSTQSPSTSQIRPNTPEATGIAGLVNKGRQTLKAVSSKINSAVAEVLS